MKKRSFLLPLAVSLTVLAAGSAVADTKPVTSIVTPATEVVAPIVPAAPAKPLVLQRSGGTKMAQYGHSSHSSHASHGSHRSHYSSR